jgi:hypothetical protein
VSIARGLGVSTRAKYQAAVELPVDDAEFAPLTSFLERVPSILDPVAFGTETDGIAWWAKFSIDVSDPLAWRAVQELAYVLNYLSLNERLPTVFMPVSPPPYLNGGVEFLSWVIECRDRSCTPAVVAEWLFGRLPRPVDDREKWKID